MIAVLHVMSTMVPIAIGLDLDVSFLFGANHCLVFESVCGAVCYVHHGLDCQISWSWYVVSQACYLSYLGH